MHEAESDADIPAGNIPDVVISEKGEDRYQGDDDRRLYRYASCFCSVHTNTNSCDRKDAARLVPDGLQTD
jgi:hypothetical protein